MSGTPLTIKIGGTAGAHAASLALLIERAEPGWVIVHGGGNEVADWSRRLGHEPATVDGLRVTDAATLDIAIAVLRGLVNARLVAAFSAAGVSAIGMSGADAGLLHAERFDARLGEVGRITAVNGALLEALGNAGHIVIVASLALGAAGGLLNVNADEVAGSIAVSRGGRLLLLTDVPGLQRDRHLVAALDVDEAEAALADGTARDGMLPKLRAAVTAARAGCAVAMVDGTDPDAVRAALDGRMTGTQISAPGSAGGAT